MFNKQYQKEDKNLSCVSNHVQNGTVITGDLETLGNIRLDGKVVGNVKSKSKAVFGKKARVEGNIHAVNAEIEGQVNGTIEISELLVLKSTANINGDIITNKLVIESGAQFNGKCQMGLNIKEIRIEKGEENPTILKAQRSS